MFAVAGFANALFIMAMIESPDTSHNKITGSNMFTSFMFAFGMHVYHNEHEELHYPVVFGLFQIILYLLLEVLMLHLLVCILHHIHDHVVSVYDQERLKAKCKMISENELLFKRSIVFKKAKYVIRVESQGGHGGSHGHGASSDDNGSTLAITDLAKTMRATIL